MTRKIPDNETSRRDKRSKALKALLWRGLLLALAGALLGVWGKRAWSDPSGSRSVRKTRFIEKIVFTRQMTPDNYDIWIMNPDGSGQIQLTESTAIDESPMISPDGRSIVFGSRRTGTGQIWIMDCNGRGQRALTQEPAGAYYPVWSPDGKTIYYSVGKGYPYDLVAIDRDGSNRRIVRARAGGTRPIVSPDGTRICHTAQPDADPNNYDMVVTTVVDGSWFSLSRKAGLKGYEHQGQKHAWSRDGVILFTGQEPRWSSYVDYDIYWVREDGSKFGVILDDGHRLGFPCWSPDERRIVYSSRTTRRGNDDIWVMNRDGSRQTQITADPRRDVSPHWGRVLRGKGDGRPSSTGRRALF